VLTVDKEKQVHLQHLAMYLAIVPMENTHRQTAT